MTQPERPRSDPTIADWVAEAVERWHRGVVMRAIVTGNNSNEVNIRREGYTNADARSYPKLAGVSVAAGDEVIMIDVTGRGGWVVLGKVVRN